MTLINSIHDWIIAHPVTMMFCLFGVSALLSLYAQEIKGFLSYWPLRTVRAGTRNSMQNRLLLLESLHESAYRLLHYLAWFSVGSIFTIFWWTLILEIGSGIIYHAPITRSFFGAIAGGITVSNIWILKGILHDLANYEKITTDLKRGIEEHNTRLANNSKVKQLS